VCFYSRLRVLDIVSKLPIGSVLEWFQLRNYINHRLYFGPILERQRVREFYDDFLLVGPILERQRVRGFLNIADAIIYVLVVRVWSVLGHPHQFMPEYAERVRGSGRHVG